MPTEGNPATRIIAVCGKGGVGKTSISAAIVRALLKRGGARVLAIDADPAVGLATALGVGVDRTVDDIRNMLIEKLESGAREDRRDILTMLDYEVFGAMVEKSGIAFLAIGRPETEGCYCQVNDILRDIIGSIAANFDYVVIDGEAGIEQVNRRVMETVTHLVLVSDASAKGLNVVKSIHEVAGRLMHCERTGLVVNRVHSPEEMERIRVPEGMEPVGRVPEDEAIRNADIDGASILSIPDSPAMAAIEDFLASIDVFTGSGCV
jgi:CO dehydrogenase maturation factor